MKLPPIVAAVTLLIAPCSFAATGIFGSYVDIFTTTSTVYRGEAFSSKSNFQGANLGTFNLTDVLLITQSEVDTFKSGSGNVTGAEIQYRVYLTSASPGSFNTQSYSFIANATTVDIGGMTITGSGDQRWGSSTDIDLKSLATAGNGNYTVEVFFKAFTNEGDRFSNNNGDNFKANFTVIPEPTSAMLGILGSALLLRRRRA